MNRRCAGRACAASPRLARWSRRCRYGARSISGRASHCLDEAVTISATSVVESRQLLPALKPLPRRRSMKVRLGMTSGHHPRWPLSLRRPAAGPPASTLIASHKSASRWRLSGHSPRVSRRAETSYRCGLNLHMIELCPLAGQVTAWTLGYFNKVRHTPLSPVISSQGRG